MVKQSWNITTTEILRILKLHETATKKQYLIKEDNPNPSGGNEKIIELGKTTFPPGYYSVEKLSGTGKQELDKKLQEVALYAKTNQKFTVKIQIEVGESQVPNRDNERGGIVLEKGKLAELRGQKLKFYLTEYFKKLVKDGYLSEVPDIPDAKTNVQLGTQKYKYVKNEIDPSTKQKYNPNDPKYLEDQYVKFKITLLPKKEGKCLIGLTVQFDYVHENPEDPLLKKCRGIHVCDYAIFDVYLNGTKIGRANLNNKICEEFIYTNPEKCDRYNDIKINNSIVDKIVSDVNYVETGQLVLWYKCVGTTCHQESPEIYIVDGAGQQLFPSGGQSPCVGSSTPKSEKKNFPLMILDKCGKVISIDPNRTTQAMSRYVSG